MGSISQIYPEHHEKWLPDHAILWRYVPLRTFLCYITGQIFIPVIEAMRQDDPFEGRFLFDTVLFNTVLRDRFGDRVSIIDDWLHKECCSESEREDIKRNLGYPNYAARIFEKHYFDILRKTRYASCWFLSDSESAAMWKSYGIQGVAIATTVGRLCHILKSSDRDFVFGQMRYTRVVQGEVHDTSFNPHDNFDSSFLLRPYFIKRDEYKSENEVRFVTSAPDKGFISGITLENINPNDWMKEICFWPGLREPEEKSLRQLITPILPNVPCYCSDLFGAEKTSNGFIRSVSDHFDELFFKNWKDGSDDIPPELKLI